MGLKMSHVPEGELIEAKDEKDEKDEREKEQKTAEKGQKQTLKNIKKITGKKQRLDNEKYNLQRKGELPLNMSNEVEGDQLDEFLGGKPGDGYIGHPNLNIKNPFAKKQTKGPVGNQTGSGMVHRVGGQIGDLRMRQNAQFKSLLNQSNEPEGEMVSEMDIRKINPGAALGRAIERVFVPPVADGTLKGKPNSKKVTEEKKPESETIEERTRYAKETGKDPQTGKESKKGGTLGGDDTHSKVMRHMQGSLRKSGGMMSSRKKPIQPQGKKKEKGAKGYHGPTPVDKIRGKLARKRAPKPDIGSRFD